MRCRSAAALAAACMVCLALSSCRPPSNRYVAPPPPEVSVGQPVEQMVTDAFEYTGTTAGLESVELRARVKGFLYKVHYHPGSFVKANDLLFTIDQRTFKATVDQAAASVASAQAALKDAEFNYERLSKLRKDEVAADQEYIDAVSNYDKCKANVQLTTAKLTSARLDLEFTEIRAPIGGVVSRNLVDEGALVGATDPTLLATVVNDAQVYVYYNVSEQDFLTLRRQHPDQKVLDTQRTVVPVQIGMLDETGYPHEGKVDAVDNKMDSSTGTIQLRGVFDNPKRAIVAGLFVRVRMPTGRRTAMLVPDSAVGIDQAGRYVLTVNDQNIVERRAVQVGRVVDQMRIIDSGLNPQDRLVVNGMQRAHVGSKITPVKASVAQTAPTSTRVSR